MLCRTDGGGAEDVEMGKCMENLGVQAGDSRYNYLGFIVQSSAVKEESIERKISE